MKMKNPDLDYNIKRLLIVTDEIGGNESEVEILVSLIEQFRKYEIEFVDVKKFSNENLRERTNYYGQFDRKNFDKDFDSLTEKISVEKLLKFSRHENPEFNKQLKESNLPIRELLWNEYQKRFQQQDSLHVSVDDYDMSGGMAKQYPDPHILTVLFNHKIISPQVQYDGILNYHFVGRGFYGFGGNSPIDPALGKKGRWKIMIPISIVADKDIMTKKAVGRELINHEWLGHIYYNLSDHFDIPSNECIMAVEPSLDSLIQNAIGHSDAYFCEKCRLGISTK
jgi:hypothetical protein